MFWLTKYDNFKQPHNRIFKLLNLETRGLTSKSYFHLCNSYHILICDQQNTSTVFTLFVTHTPGFIFYHLSLFIRRLKLLVLIFNPRHTTQFTEHKQRL